ncbi:dTDP-4-dehydrorhamnose reductase [Desmospora profundinema]|uniref:dTDP-4-dehydrorhamnose reductase n=1 Tax=Desmospora profundinema TaxID=1571184 RepID=A0ABU1IHX9_9BACL|nr:dTDP-4-dehydrorhamnose reductase [Desmospora profundinema]MDR6224301.1 dTDP-4-dehydrorhamnose reductase [Desmospora profundinema]
MKILVTGAGGQLGRDIVHTLSLHHDVRGLVREEWDVTRLSHSDHWVEREKPDTIIHCAAFTQVDTCETQPRQAFMTNTIATKHLASICGDRGIRLVYISTDYVFDGKRKEGYVESDPVCPINVYGKTKWMGERWVRKRCSRYLILRTAWLFGRGGQHFPGAMLERAKRGMPLRVVTDQVGCPTYTGHLAQGLLQLLEREDRGVFHMAGNGSCSWHEFAEAVLEEAGICHTVIPITSNELKRSAPRPACSILRTERDHPLPHWREGLIAFMQSPHKTSSERMGGTP